MGISLKIIYLFLLAGSHREKVDLFIGDMYNRYTCLLQPCRHLTLKLLIQDHPRSAEVPHVADFKSSYISLIIGSRGLQCEKRYRKSWARNLLMWSDLTLDPSFNVKTTYRKSWAGNLLMWSDLTLDPSFKVKRG